MASPHGGGMSLCAPVQAYIQRLPKLMQMLSGLGLIDRVLVARGAATAATAAPPSYIVHSTAVLQSPGAGAAAVPLLTYVHVWRL